MVLLLLACAPVVAPDTPSQLPDEAAVESVVELIAPGTALELLDTLMGDLPDCEPASFEDGVGLRETWTCPTFDGTVDRYEDEDLVWMEVNGLLLESFRMDGAIELVVEDRVSTLELAATLCGDDWSDCDEPIQADLTWTLIETDVGLDVLVTGTLVTPELGPTLVEGSLELDEACELPASGLLLLEGREVHTLRYQDCDCADWALDGETIGSFCQ